MKLELDKALCQDFPLLYKQRQKDDARFGFSIEDGWEPIVRKLSEKLEAIIKTMPEQERAETFVLQVKEKFGGLRFYMNRSSPEMERLISNAEAQCEVTCELCGSVGETQGKNWLRTLCLVCHLSEENGKLSRLSKT